MNRSRRKDRFFNIGFSSLLIIFVILCLVTFAILSLSAAAADDNRSRRAADRQTDYYAAVLEAEEICRDIDDLLSEGREAALETYSHGDISLTLSETDGIRSVSFLVPAGESRHLEVALQLTEAGADHYYEILRWETGNDSEWQGDEGLTLLDPFGN